MARTALTKTTSPAPYPTAGQAITMNAADAVNQNYFTFTGKEIILIHNSGASTRTYTLTASADAFGRAVDIGPTNIAAGVTHVIGPFTTLAGWKQTNGQFYLEANHAEVLFGIIVVP